MAERRGSLAGRPKRRLRILLQARNSLPADFHTVGISSWRSSLGGAAAAVVVGAVGAIRRPGAFSDARELHGVHGHVLEQVQPADVDSLGRHGDGAVLHVLEEGRARR